MRIATILPVLTMLAVNLRAQAPLAKPGSVEGVVTNSVTGEPVKKAAVMLGGKYTAIADAAGHFRIENVVPGDYFVIADKDGFFAMTPRQSRLRVTVAEEQHVQDVALKLTPLGVVSGHVLDEQGDPIAGAQISVLRYSYGLGRKRLNQVGFAQANDLGEFEALNLRPGRYYFQVTAVPPRNIPPHTRWTHPEEAYPATFYPNARESAQAAATDVAPGAHVSDIDFRLRKMPAYHIRGKVNDENARPGTEGRVGVETSGPALEGNITGVELQADGSFDLRGLVNGSYTVSYFRFASEKGFNASQTVRVSDADVNGVGLAQKPPVMVFGAITMEGAQPDKLNLQASLAAMQGGGQHQNAGIGGDGSFMIAAVPEQVCRLEISNVPSGKYVKSIRFSDREIMNGEIDLTEHTGALLKIVLGEDGGELEGTVQTASGQPAAAMQVTLAPAEEYDARADLLKRTVTDASGNFQIKDIAPGDYRVFAWESDPEGSTQSAEFRKPFESRSVAVTVGPRDKASVQVNVITDDDVEKERSNLP
jgi:5-hydroxyisourate hydrolase-like protein (transthyretin family)